MPVYVHELIAAADLGLIPLHRVSGNTTPIEISWVSITELDDPTKFLRGGEVVLTTGVHHATEERRREFVRRISGVPVAALGFATGFVHQSVPDEIIDTAREVGLVLFEVPLPTPFTAISRWFADRLYDDRYKLLRQVAAAQKELVAALVNDLSLRSLVLKLNGLLGVAVAVIDAHGELLASSPGRTVWPPVSELHVVAQQLNRDEYAQSQSPSAMTAAAVDIEGVTVAYLCAATSPELSTLMQFAVDLIGLELARRQAVLTGNREMLGQVIEDVLAEHVSAEESIRRFAIHGLDINSSFRVLVGDVDCSPERLRRIPWNVAELVGEHSEDLFAALVDDSVVTIDASGRDSDQVAGALLETLSRLGSGAAVGVSRPHRGVHGLRIGLFEARRAVSQGPGRHSAEEVNQLSLPGLLLFNSTVPVRDIALATLRPMIDHDRQRGTDLVNTLRVYLDSDCSAARTAEALFIHRNGLQYRLERIATLTGCNLASVEDRAHLWLALSALDIP